MENRIEINGVWYVREDQIGVDDLSNPPKDVEPRDHDWEHIVHRGIEINDYIKGWRLEVNVLDTDAKFSMPCIELFYRKTPDSDWKSEEVMDNESWMIGIVEGRPGSLKHIKEYSLELQTAIIYACQQMKKRIWISKN
jgi:hypothetical protein